MLKELEAWKLEAGIDRVEITAEMDAQHFRTGFGSEPFCTKLYNRRCPHTPAEYTLETNVDAKRLRMETILSQPAPPPHCDLSPRRFPAVGTGLNEPGAPHAETQSMERKGIFP